MNAIIEYFKANPLFFWIIVACVAVLLILIIVAIAKAAHKSKHKAKESFAPENDTAAATATAETVSSSSQKTLQADNSASLEAESSESSAPAAASEQTTVPESSPAALETTAADNQIPEDITSDKADLETEDKTQSNAVEKEDRSSLVGADQSRVASRPAAEKLIEKTADEEDKKSIYTGKWVIRKNEDSTYYFELRASNGEKLLTSIDYTSLSGAKNGIKTHKNNILRDNIVISQNKKKQYFFKLLNGSKQLLCTGETYPTKSRCESAVDSVKRFAESAVVTVQKDDDDAEE